MSYHWFNSQELLQKAKDKYYNVGSKQEAVEYYLKNKGLLKEKAKTCEKKKKKQKEDTEEIGIETRKKMQAKRVKEMKYQLFV